ncbi:MAG: ferredoxin-type protein NapF [Pasteurellaceae bacterium]|nr:ferredoxin-type protein NapF [Pasteurellaceae bacterium]
MESSLSRRHFLRGSFLNSLKSEQAKQQGLNVIRPPWADLAKFVDHCTACNACIQACEMQILVKGAGGYPEVDFSQGRKECSFCQACVKACELPIFRSTTEEPWTHKVEIQPNCLAMQNVECRRCDESCESRAIRFKREIGRVATPFLELESCNGCGACLSVCPTQSIKILV